MARVSAQKRAELESFWRGHHEGWERSALNQREYCALHGLPLKRFGNWRVQFMDEAAVAKSGLLYRRGGELSHMTSHMTNRENAPLSTGYVPSGRTAPDARRNFRVADKKRILKEALAPGSSVLAVARHYGIAPRVLFRWKRELAPEAEPVFVPVTISDAPDQSGFTGPTMVERVAPEIEVELAGGQRVRFNRDMEPEMVRTVLALLEGRAQC